VTLPPEGRLTIIGLSTHAPSTTMMERYIYTYASSRTQAQHL